MTAQEFLTGDSQWARPRDVVVNLCRSTRYLSPGYYVSLLAEARGQRVLPRVDTLRELGNRDSVLRTLAEDGIPVWPAEVPEGTETHDLLLCFGRTPRPDLARLGAAVHRRWPAPILRIRLARRGDEWNFVQVSLPSVASLTSQEVAYLTSELTRVIADGPKSHRPPTDKRVVLGVLFDESDPFGPSTPETIEKLERIAARRDVHVRRLDVGAISRLGECDSLFIRTLTGLNEPAFRFASRAEALGMPVIDDTPSIIRCSNKVFLHELLKRERIPMPATLVVTSRTSYDEMADRLGLPFIVKLPDGSFSTAVHKIESRGDFQQLCRPMFRNSPLVIAQAYTPTDFDWRVGILQGRPLFVAKYHMAHGHWQIRSASSRGVRYGRVEAVPRTYAPRDVLRVAIRAASLIGGGFYGVDIKETPEGPLVIEVNDNPNLETGYEDAADGNVIYEELIDHFVQQVEKSSRRPRPRPPRPARDPFLAVLRRPIGPRHREPAPDGYRAFEVCGLELEYVTVDRDLNAVSLVETSLASLAGRPTSEATLGSVAFSNEIFDHVLEIKVPVPTRSLVHQERWLAAAVRRLAAMLRERDGARLMPTGMHPWMNPRRARLWSRSGGRIYRTYERLFDIYTHGWANVQASHVNLPVGRDEEAAAMMNAAALVIPYLPALAASSPLRDGDLQPEVDGRLAQLADHQARVPETLGLMVPEYVESLPHYKRLVLEPIYAAVDRLKDAAALRHEYFNARGAVFKLSRNSMEIRILDTQECVKLDVAIAAFVRATIKALTTQIQSGRLVLPAHEVLVEDYRAAYTSGSRAQVRAPHLRPDHAPNRDEAVPIPSVLRRLLELAERTIRKDELPYLELISSIIEQGSLSERISMALQPYVDDDDGFTDAARRLYVELTDCLRDNRPWPGRDRDVDLGRV